MDSEARLPGNQRWRSRKVGRSQVGYQGKSSLTKPITKKQLEKTVCRETLARQLPFSLRTNLELGTDLMPHVGALRISLGKINRAPSTTTHVSEKYVQTSLSTIITPEFSLDTPPEVPSKEFSFTEFSDEESPIMLPRLGKKMEVKSKNVKNAPMFNHPGKSSRQNK